MNIHHICVKGEPLQSHRWPPWFHSTPGSYCTDIFHYIRSILSSLPFTMPRGHWWLYALNLTTTYCLHRKKKKKKTGLRHYDVFSELWINFLAGLRLNIVLAQAGPKSTDNFSNQEHMWKTLVSEETLYGPPVLSPVDSMISLPLPELYILIAVKMLLPPCWYPRPP